MVTRDVTMNKMIAASGGRIVGQRSAEGNVDELTLKVLKIRRVAHPWHPR